MKKKNNRKNTIPRTQKNKQNKIREVHWCYRSQEHRTSKAPVP